MGSTRQFLLITLAVLAMLPSAASAQNWDEPWSDPRDRPSRVDLTVTAGMLAPTDWSDLVILGSLSSVSGALEQVLVRDVRIEPDRVFGGAVTYWRDRYGFRAHVERSRSSLTVGGEGDGGRERLAPNINSWLYDVRGAIGLVEYSPARKVWPYVFVGLGAITYDLDRTISPPLLTFIEHAGTRRDARGDVVIVEEDGREFILAVDELGLETVLAVNFGAGCDLRLPVAGGGLGLRLEVSDHVSTSPLGLRIRELGTFGGLDQGDAVRFGAVHHLRAAVGLVVQVGR